MQHEFNMYFWRFFPRSERFLVPWAIINPFNVISPCHRLSVNKKKFNGCLWTNIYSQLSEFVPSRIRKDAYFLLSITVEYLSSNTRDFEWHVRCVSSNKLLTSVFTKKCSYFLNLMDKKCDTFRVLLDDCSRSKKFFTFLFFLPLQFVWSPNWLEFLYQYPLLFRPGRQSYRTNPCIAKKTY